LVVVVEGMEGEWGVAVAVVAVVVVVVVVAAGPRRPTWRPTVSAEYQPPSEG